jgi:hypothetical protein
MTEENKKPKSIVQRVMEDLRTSARLTPEQIEKKAKDSYQRHKRDDEEKKDQDKPN